MISDVLKLALIEWVEDARAHPSILPADRHVSEFGQDFDPETAVSIGISAMRSILQHLDPTALGQMEPRLVISVGSITERSWEPPPSGMSIDDIKSLVRESDTREPASIYLLPTCRKYDWSEELTQPILKHPLSDLSRPHVLLHRVVRRDVRPKFSRWEFDVSLQFIADVG